MIPAEAVEAAAKAISGAPDKWGDLPEKFRQEYRDAITPVLEAATPYMLAIAWDEGFSEGWDTGDPHANPYRQP